MACLRGGRGGILEKYMIVEPASRASLRPSESAMALMVAQLGASTSLVVRIDLGQNLVGTAKGLNYVNPKYSTLGLNRQPPNFDN